MIPKNKAPPMSILVVVKSVLGFSSFSWGYSFVSFVTLCGVFCGCIGVGTVSSFISWLVPFRRSLRMLIAVLISLCILLSGLVLFNFWFLINIRRQL